MANPMYGQNQADNDIDIYGRGKVSMIGNGGSTVTLTAEDSGAYCLFDTAGASQFNLPAPAAAKSLAIPLTDKQSDLLGVKFISIIGSSNLNILLN